MISISYRNANINDMEFLAEAIIEAEKNGTKIFSYSTIFGIDEKLAKKYIIKMLSKNLHGCELSTSSYVLALVNNKPVATIGAWIESQSGLPSKTIKGNLLLNVIPKEILGKAKKISSILSDLHIDYIEGYLCLGIVYIKPKYRGLGILKGLLNEQILKNNLKINTNKICIQVFCNNLIAIKAYEKLGFKKSKIVASDNELIINYLPFNKKMLMKIKTQNGKK